MDIVGKKKEESQAAVGRQGVAAANIRLLSVATSVVTLPFLLDGCAGGGGSSLPMTPAKIAKLVQDSIKNPSNPIVSVACGQSATDRPDSNGVGTYDCDETFQSGMGFHSYKVAADGSRSRVS